MTKFFKILILLFLSAPVLIAQNQVLRFEGTDIEEKSNYTVENITLSDGLHNINVHDVLQDSRGFLWLASGNGLQKYDGYTFTFYSPGPTDSTLEGVYGLFEDKHRNMWLQRETGLSRYRRESDDFVNYDFVNSENDTIPYQVFSMAEDLKETLWVWIHDHGLYRVDLENKNFIPQAKVNQWFRNVKKQMVLKETNRKGIYETRITFPAGHYGWKLQYKFTIKRKHGVLEWEPNPNPASGEYGNRELILTGDTLILPAVAFNSPMRIDPERKTLPENGIKPTHVTFSVNLNKLANPLLEGDEIQVRGDIPPLRWQEDFLVNCIVFGSDNDVWIGTNYRGLFRLNLETGERQNFISNPGISGSMSSNTVTTAIADRDGDLWFGSNSGLNKFNSEKKTFENYYIDPANKWNSKNGFHKLQDDGHGSIWTLSLHDDGGIGHFNKESKKFTHYSTGFGREFCSITLDRSGIVWLANEYYGLFKLNPKAKKFLTFSIRKNGKDVLKDKIIYSVYEDRGGKIWIGGDLNRLYCYNRETGKSIAYRTGSDYPDNVGNNAVNYIFQDKRGILWIGTVGGLSRFHSETGRFKRIASDSLREGNFGRTSYIFEDVHGILWVLTRNGYLVQLNPAANEAEFFSVFGNSDLDRRIEFCDLIEDPEGFFWIASGNLGLYKFDLVRKKFSFVEKIGKINIAAIYLDNDGILWCGTYRQGLIRYDTKTNTKIVIREENGLLSASIVGLEPDQFGNLWLSSQKGLSRYNPQTGAFKHYFKEDGFFSNEFSYLAHARGKNGELIFGSLHGVVTFHPDSIKESDYLPPIVLTDFQIHNKPVGIGKNSPLKEHISVSDEITLAHHQNDLSITFAALDFSHPERNQYSFFLENFEENWRPSEMERTAYYTNLDPGEYVFRVKGTNNDGVWNEEGVSLIINISPPWWKTGWARALFALLILGMLYGLRRYEMNRQRLKHELELEQVEAQQLQRMDHLKSRFFANISHEFRTPLTLISGPLQQLRSGSFTGNVKDLYEMMLRNSDRLLRLINQLLDLSKLESGGMKLHALPEDIVTLTRQLTMSFESLAKRKDIVLKFHTNPRNGHDRSLQVYIDREKYEKIVTNLLSNAFKFTAAGGKVSVIVERKAWSVKRRENGDLRLKLKSEARETKCEKHPAKSQTLTAKSSEFVSICVKDTGIGIPEEKLTHIFDRFYQVEDSATRGYEGTGIGLALTKELVVLHHGEINVESGVGVGTTFTVRLPLGKAHLKPEQIVERGALSVEQEALGDERNALEQPNTPIPEHPNTRTLEHLILIVEDNPDMRAYIRDNLQEYYQTNEAENGIMGLKKARKIMPDLIISDVMMPEMDGMEFCERLKNDPQISHIPVILLTARAARQDKLEGLETGADDYLVKPFDAKELIARAKNLIKQRRRLQERFRREVEIEPAEVTNTSMDAVFLQKVMTAVEAHIDNVAFNTHHLASEAGVSRRHLNRKLRGLTGQTTREFIRTIRLKRAAQLLQQHSGTVTEIAYDVGFQNIGYFAKVFREQFGVSPSEYGKGE